MLISGLWEEDPSPQRERNLHVQVYQLRRRLAEAEPGGSRLICRDPGHQLALGPSELDLTQFTVLAGRGRLLARSGDHATAAAVLGRALALWRGPALADVVDASARLAADAAALEDQRGAAAEDLAAAQLELGMWAEAASELAGLVAQHPLRERLRGLLMLALYRSGRQADTLECYQLAGTGGVGKTALGAPDSRPVPGRPAPHELRGCCSSADYEEGTWSYGGGSAVGDIACPGTNNVDVSLIWDDSNTDIIGVVDAEYSLPANVYSWWQSNCASVDGSSQSATSS